jgi:hypothetical protein
MRRKKEKDLLWVSARVLRNYSLNCRCGLRYGKKVRKVKRKKSKREGKERYKVKNNGKRKI